MLHRNQEQLDAIRDLLVQQRLMDSENASDFTFHLGDIIDSCIEFPNLIRKLELSLLDVQRHPAKCSHALLAFVGELEHHLPEHFRGVVSLAWRACEVLVNEFPSAFPWAHEESENKESL